MRHARGRGGWGNVQTQTLCTKNQKMGDSIQVDSVVYTGTKMPIEAPVTVLRLVLASSIAT